MNEEHAKKPGELTCLTFHSTNLKRVTSLFCKQSAIRGMEEGHRNAWLTETNGIPQDLSYRYTGIQDCETEMLGSNAGATSHRLRDMNSGLQVMEESIKIRDYILQMTRE